VFGVGVDHPLALALEKCGYHNIHDIIVVMSLVDIKALAYEDDQGKVITLPAESHQFQIRIVQRYQDHRST
jgi:hypothetical protein